MNGSTRAVWRAAQDAKAARRELQLKREKLLFTLCPGRRAAFLMPLRENWTIPSAGRELLEAAFPQLPLLWLGTEQSGGEVFWIEAAAL